MTASTFWHHMQHGLRPEPPPKPPAPQQVKNPGSKPRWPKSTIADVFRLRREGLKPKKISATLNIPYSTVKGWLATGE